MRKVTVFSELDFRIGKIIDGDEITKQDEALIDLVIQKSETIPDEAIQNIKNNIILSQDSLEKVAGIEMPSIEVLLERTHEYDPKKILMSFESTRDSYEILRRSLATNLAFFYKDAIMEVKQTTYLVTLQKRYIDYLKEKHKVLENAFEKSLKESNKLIVSDLNGSDPTAILEEA